LAATILPHEYFPSCLKAAIIAAYCMQKLHAIIAHETTSKIIAIILAPPAKIAAYCMQLSRMKPLLKRRYINVETFNL